MSTTHQPVCAPLVRDVPLIDIASRGVAPLRAQFLPAGPPGEKGAPGDAAGVSADLGNTARIGSDGRIFVPEPSWASINW